MARPVAEVLYLKSLTIDRFKSFKHAEILISKGFTCVVGPNGSGKSNICDALLFGLGESSLTRLRVSRLDELIDFGVKRKKSEVARAHVRLEFSGDSDYSITRTVRSDGKTQYSVNGRQTTRGEVLEILGHNRIRADETSTITQGEINRTVSLNPKERRELIEIASGIKEFEAKKEDALRELEKVSQRISETQGMLGEKVSFLKELEKEKDAAEKFAEYSAGLKTLRYSILVARKAALATDLDAYMKEHAVMDSARNTTELKRSELAKRISDLESEREGITHKMSASSTAMAEVNSSYEAINRELVTIGAEMNSQKAALVEIGTFTEAAEAEMARITASIAEGARTLGELQQRLRALEAEEKAHGTPAHAQDSGQAEAEALSGKIGSLEKRVEAGRAELLSVSVEIAALEHDAEEAMKAAEAARSTVAGKEGAAAAARKALDETKAALKKASSDAKAFDAELERLGKEMESVDERMIELKEQRSHVSARSGAVLTRLSAEFDESDGFYGSVAALCTYDTAHARAVEAAAGARLDYLVVDSIATADLMIAFLKKNELGRATFVPLKEIRTGEPDAEEKGLSRALDAVRYEKRFERVFRYVFGNTYIAPSASEAARRGVGRHRYVTLEGELIEQSGTVSGGYSKMRQSLASIDAELRELSSRKEGLHSGKSKADSSAFESRKAQAAAEMASQSRAAELSRLERELSGARESIKELSSRSAGAGSRLAELRGRAASCSAANAASEKELSAAKERLVHLYNEAVEASRSRSGRAASKEERERAAAAAKEAEALRIRTAEIRKEAELTGARKADLERQAAEKKKLGKEITASIGEKAARAEALERQRKEAELRLRSSGEVSKKSMERLARINDEVERLREDYGRINVQLNEIDRQVGEVKVKRSQTETRMGDIGAELAAYGTGIAVLKGDAEIMVREADVMESRLKDLGTVNMRAPELYEEKKRSVDEALAKANTLEAERQAVIRMIEEIESRKLQVFMLSFNEVNKNFSKLYNYVFPGRAYIELENPSEPFSGGVEIRISDANVEKALRSMSGGQKSLILLMLLFSIHLCKPSSVYVFDEVDSALDKENSKKLSQLIKEMSSEAQFVVVSHNDSLIANSDTAVGVVMSSGESRVVGIEVSSATRGQARV